MTFPLSFAHHHCGLNSSGIGISSSGIRCSPENRGCHLGTMLLQSAVREIFSSGIEEIYCEARDTTVHIVEKLGGKITGDPVPFYDGNVTPMILKRIYYFDDSVDKR